MRRPDLFRYLFLIPFLALCLLLPDFGLAQNLLGSGHGTGPDQPMEVGIGIHIDQIVSVDQKSENYAAVVTLRAEWNDPVLAYDEEEFGLGVRVFKINDFVSFVAPQPTFIPAFVIENQQSNRWIHQAVVALWPSGRVRYYEKSSLTLQAPYFDFRKYPFDTQQFYFEIVSVFPTDVVRYTVLEEGSGLGELLGEEEWILEHARMELSTTTGLSGLESGKVALAFEGRRHVLYYMIRIFLPMLVLITVSWALFFLDEYRKRIEIAGANLLVFVAFNWAVSEDLPKLGYLTFLDFILQWMFVVTGGVIVFNVILRRLKVSGREVLAARLDNYALKWIYPLAYAAIVGFAVTRYLIID